MNNKFKLSHVSITTALAVVFLLMVAYVPMLGLLVFVTPVPYAIISSRAGLKYSLMSAVVSFFIVLFLVDPMYALTTTIMNILPGIAIGYKINLNYEEKFNFEPIYWGILAFIASILLMFGISKLIFNINPVNTIVDGFRAMLDIAIQEDILKTIGQTQGLELTIDEIVDMARILIPTMLFLYSIISTFIAYYATTFIMRRTGISKNKFPKFSEFHLPGNTVLILFILYLGVLVMGSMNTSLNTNSILINLQLVFGYLFIIQGIAVFIFLLRKHINTTISRVGIFVFVLIFMSGFMAMGLVGLLDSVIDFRKLKIPKTN